MHQKMMRLKPLHGWNTTHSTVTLQEPNSAYKYPDGIVLTLKTSNQADHYFVERNYAIQLASGIKEALLAKTRKHKPTENKAQQSKKKQQPRNPSAKK